jgi:hypothetical protein
MTDMPEEPYPTEGLDVSWLGVDRDGYMGVFITGGWAPIPTVALRQDALSITKIEPLILEMPRVSAADSKVAAPDISAFIDLAERGFFVYDWVDECAVASGYGAYGIEAVPRNPIGVETITGTLATAAMPRFWKMRFADRALVDVRAEMRCYESNRTLDEWEISGSR